MSAWNGKTEKTKEGVRRFRYSAMIVPEHPVVAALYGQEIAQSGSSSGNSRAWSLKQIVRLLERFDFEAVPGVASLDETCRRRAGNCFALACLFVALARRAGFRADEVFAAISSPGARWKEHIHAFVIVHCDDPELILVIDPAVLKPISMKGSEFLAENPTFVVFNDQIQAMLAAEKRTVLRI